MDLAAAINLIFMNSLGVRQNLARNRRRRVVRDSIRRGSKLKI
jgi:hypothetical protein